jgi:hypothetical protein
MNAKKAENFLKASRLCQQFAVEMRGLKPIMQPRIHLEELMYVRVRLCIPVMVGVLR